MSEAKLGILHFFRTVSRCCKIGTSTCFHEGLGKKSIYESGSSLVQRVTSLRFFAAGPLQPDGFSAAAAIRACEHAGQWPLALALLQGTVKR